MPLTAENTKKFAETNPFHPYTIKQKESALPCDVFGIILDFTDGSYSFFNSHISSGTISNEHFTPIAQRKLKTIKDLNRLWMILTGDNLTLL